MKTTDELILDQIFGESYTTQLLDALSVRIVTIQKWDALKSYWPIFGTRYYVAPYITSDTWFIPQSKDGEYILSVRVLPTDQEALSRTPVHQWPHRPWYHITRSACPSSRVFLAFCLANLLTTGPGKGAKIEGCAHILSDTFTQKGG